METKNLAIDALRLPLIILVVFIHMNPTFDSVGYWGLTINTIAQVAVPCFFVIAGYFFVGNKPLTLEMYKVKLKKESGDAAHSLFAVELGTFVSADWRQSFLNCISWQIN